MSITRRNHYVPQWYQRGFLPAGSTKLFYLDLDPPHKELPDGRLVTMNALNHLTPKRCFRLKDLYTTMIFGIPNDEIERYLFGSIDNEGSKAIKALVGGDISEIAKHFQMIFEYMDTQKIRTPKGLDWINSHYFQLDQIRLMVQMQALRQMHCTMWVEGVMEIVSAKNSKTKFIVSDHPVTIYNHMCPPDSSLCEYPNDPPTALIGSQTIFPLDIDHCFILSNLEYARDPKNADATSNRTNVRYFAQTLTRIDSVIRERELLDNEVLLINYILKKRARKYIAAAKTEWLYPENSLKDVAWNEIGEVLVPPSDELWMFGGETYVGYKNGSVDYQDELGRKFKTPEDEFRDYSNIDRNRLLFNAIYEIFELSKGKDWIDVRREISDEQVKDLHLAIAQLWHVDTDIFSILPKPDDTLKGLYLGVSDPRAALANIIGYSIYTDKVIVISPFMNAWHMRKEYDPISSPTQYKNQTIRNVSYFLTLFPLIDAGIVEFIPDPCDFNIELRRRAWTMGRERLKGLQLDEEDLEYIKPAQIESMMSSFYNLPRDILKQNIKRIIPDLTEEEIESHVDYIVKQMEEDPFIPLHTTKPGKDHAQLTMFHTGANLELGFFLAQLTGSFIYTDMPFRYKEIMTSVKLPEYRDAWSPIEKSLQEVDFSFFDIVDPSFVIYLREKGRFEKFRQLLRDVLKETSNIEGIERTQELSDHYAGLVKEIGAYLESEWEAVKSDYNLWKKEIDREPVLTTFPGKLLYQIPFGGFGFDNAYQLLMIFGGSRKYEKSIPFLVFLDFKNRGVSRFQSIF